MADDEQRLARIFSDFMLGETAPVPQRTRLNCATWDSLMHLNLVSAIEQEFCLTLSDDDVADMHSFETALHIIRAKRPSSEASHADSV